MKEPSGLDKGQVSVRVSKDFGVGMIKMTERVYY